jgi:hypothetical protein
VAIIGLANLQRAKFESILKGSQVQDPVPCHTEVGKYSHKWPVRWLSASIELLFLATICLGWECRSDLYQRFYIRDDMKIIIALAVLMIAMSEPVFARGSSYGSGHSSYSHISSGGRSDHTVRGYTKANGAHVDSYHATNGDSTKNNNYSTKGNVNPYTGKTGTKKRDGE